MDEAEVRRIAELAGLELSEVEARRLAGELDAMLERLEELRALEPDVAEVRDASADSELRLRPDAPAPEPLARGPEDFAPAWQEGFFVLPRVSAMDEAGEDAP